MKNLRIWACSAFLALAALAEAQELVVENAIEIAGKSKRGYLGNVVTDDAKKQLDLYFITKSTNKKVKFQVYQFDYDLKFLGDYTDEQELEKVRTKYSWFNYRGESEVVQGITAEPDLAGRVVFVKREISYKYNWLTGRYNKSVKTLDKVKPKGDEDKRFTFYNAFPLDETGEVLALAGQRGTMKEFEKPLREYTVMKVNSNLDIVNQEVISFSYVMRILWQGPVSTGYVAEDEEETGDWAIIFATLDHQGYGKFKDPNPLNYMYVRIGRDGKVKEKIPFAPKAGFWKIEGAFEKEGGVYVYGLSKRLKKPEEAYYSFTDQPQATEKGFLSFQMVGFKGGKTLFVSAPNLDEFETKTTKPDSQKKPNLYKGGRMSIGGIDITKSGEIFINAQEYTMDPAGKYRAKNYDDFLMFHFSKDGELVRVYGVDNPQKGGFGGVVDPNMDPKFYPTESTIFEGKNNTLYWMMYFVSGIEKRSWNDGSTQYTSYTPRKQIRMGTIDAAGAKISDFKTFGDGTNGKKKIFLMNEFPVVKINGGNQLIFLGEDTNKWGMDSSGDYIWLGKFDPMNL